MNKLTKVGVSALCGSLAAVSAANAGAMSVAGGATATYFVQNSVVTGNPLGLASNLTFSGSGELDNGNTFSVTVTNADKSTFSTAQLSFTAAGIGTFKVDPGGGTGIDRLDDKMPTAWEEVDGTGLGMGLQTVVGAGGSMDIEWQIDSGFLPEGLSAYLAWSPHPDGSFNNDKSASGTTDDGTVTGDGWDIVVEHSGLQDGLNIFAGYSDISQTATSGGSRKSHAIGGTYAVSGFTVGYQYSRDLNPGSGTDIRSYTNNAYAVSFNVNDDLSVSYGVHESVKNSNSPDVTLKGESIQIAYTMGGATLKWAETDVDNANYSTAVANDKEGRTIALSLAF